MQQLTRFVILVSILIYSCHREILGGLPPPEVQIRYVDSAGNDIFSPSHDGQNGYWMDSVRLYDYENGVQTLIFQPTTLAVKPGHPYGYVFTTYSNISNIQGEYLIVFANTDVVNNYNNYIIQVKDGLFDTMKVYLTGNYSAGIYGSVWYNSVYEPSGANAGFMTIVK